VFSPANGLNFARTRRLKMVASQVVTRDNTREKLFEAIQGYADDRSCQEVLLFLGRHPRARFSRLAIIHALNGYKWYTEQALNRLTNDGVIRRYLEGTVPLYSLSADK
jgi:hypothetical protein